MATAHRYTPALAWPPLPSGRLGPLMYAYTRCSNLHRRSRVHVHVVCLRACSGAAESHEEIAPARIDHAYTHSSSLQISHTGYRYPVPRVSHWACKRARARARVRVRTRQDLTAITPPPLACAYSRSSSLQIAHADDTPLVLSPHCAVGVRAAH